MKELITICYSDGHFKFRVLLWSHDNVLRKIYYNTNGSISSINNPAVINYDYDTKKIKSVEYEVNGYWGFSKTQWRNHIKNII